MKSNTVAARSSSLKELPNPDNVILTTLEKLKKKSIKKKRFTVDLDNPDLHATKDNNERAKQDDENKVDTEEDDSKEEESKEDSDEYSAASKGSEAAPIPLHTPQRSYLSNSSNDSSDNKASDGPSPIVAKNTRQR